MTESTTQRTVSASYMNTLLDAFASQGGAAMDKYLLLEQAGLSQSDLSDPDARLPVEVVTKVWQSAKDTTGNRLIGLQVGEHIRPGSFSVLGHLLMTCATLKDALESASRFATLVGDGGILEVEFTSHGAELTYDLVERTIPCREERIEAIVASLIGFSRWITGSDILPKQVNFTHKAPADQSAYLAYFKITPTFGSPKNTMVFDNQTLGLPLQQANPTLSALLDSHAEKILSRLTGTTPFLLQLRQLILKSFQQGTPELTAIATQLGLTERALQRKLAELDTSFKEQLNILRKEAAMEYLQSGDRSLSEIAYMLGFSDPASFSRAFKRWTGVPPGKWIERK
ncbi:MAG: AraC family transcriptional regulator [Rhodospirillales bacterium]|nr:AraC family transcriptional regulator [Rhodospirillales bacterium]